MDTSDVIRGVDVIMTDAYNIPHRLVGGTKEKRHRYVVFILLVFGTTHATCDAIILHGVNHLQVG